MDEVERIAREWFEAPCPPEEEAFCNPELHVWETGHPEDKAHAMKFVAFVLARAGRV